MTKQTHFRIRGYYCKSAEPHDGPCPMVRTFFNKIRVLIRTRKWPSW